MPILTELFFVCGKVVKILQNKKYLVTSKILHSNMYINITYIPLSVKVLPSHNGSFLNVILLSNISGRNKLIFYINKNGNTTVFKYSAEGKSPAFKCNKSTKVLVSFRWGVTCQG